MTKTKHIIDRLIKVHGLSQADITRETGIAQPRMSKWAAGRIPIGADDALALDALLDRLDGTPVKKRQRKEK